MNNPEGKVTYSVELELGEDVQFLKSARDGKTRFDFTFKLTNAGRRSMEEITGLTYAELNARIGQGRIGMTETTALLFGATRKFHARRIPNLQAADEFMDALMEKMEDADEEDGETGDYLVDLQVALLAANARRTITQMRKDIGLDPSDDGEDDGDEADDSDDSEDEEDEDGDAAPKDEPSAKPQAETKGRAVTRRGKSSSAKA